MTASTESNGAHRQNLSPLKFFVTLVLFFFSGLVALVYEVLWMKELGLLFGNTAYSAATTLATFFFGLAVGGYFWGQRAARLDNPLQIYGLLELAVAVSVTGYFQIHDAYHALYPALFDMFGPDRWIFVAVKFLLSVVLLFPPAFFIGGTLPVMSQYFVRNMDHLGLRVSILYGVNTLGAAIGSLLAGFYLPRLFGFSLSYWLAVGGTAMIGCVAVILAWRWQDYRVVAVPQVPIKLKRGLISLSTIRILVVVSGFGTLYLQVLWTRMFAQVLQNSVYTFATILFVFLLSLSMGAIAANWVMKRDFDPPRVLFWLFTVGAMCVASSPFLFNAWTDGLHYIGAQTGWSGYLIQVFKMEVAVMAFPVFLLGAIFPFLLKLAESSETSPGRLVGQLVALNTIGAILGSLTAGFIVLQAVGLWAGIRLVGMIYLLAGLYLIYIEGKPNRAVFAVPVIGILLLVSVLDTTRLPQVKIDPVADDESLLEVWESSSGTVAVIRRGDSLKIKVNNYYTLGGSGSRDLEEVEGYLPLLLHRKPETVFFLGLGTGISAGAILHFPVQRLLVAELIPEVVQASKKYFGRFNNRLFFDPRARVIEEDGRNFLAGTQQKFDLIIADLFVPWRSGAGSLYSLEHYWAVRKRLEENGLFMQWLPTYQLSKAEFGIIVRTMSQVFPHVTLWRGNFSSRKPIVGLLAQSVKMPLATDALIFSKKERQNFGEHVPVLAHYVGNIGMLAGEQTAYPVNSDDKPVIEYQAPIMQRRQKNQELDWMVGDGLIRFMEHVQDCLPPEVDFYLKNLSADIRGFPRAGMYLHRSQVLKKEGRLIAAKEVYARYTGLLPGGIERP